MSAAIQSRRPNKLNEPGNNNGPRYGIPTVPFDIALRDWSTVDSSQPTPTITARLRRDGCSPLMGDNMPYDHGALLEDLGEFSSDGDSEPCFLPHFDSDEDESADDGNEVEAHTAPVAEKGGCGRTSSPAAELPNKCAESHSSPAMVVAPSAPSFGALLDSAMRHGGDPWPVLELHAAYSDDLTWLPGVTAAGGAEAVARAMGNRPADLHLRVCGLRLLTSVAQDENARAALVEHGGEDALTSAMDAVVVALSGLLEPGTGPSASECARMQKSGQRAISLFSRAFALVTAGASNHIVTGPVSGPMLSHNPECTTLASRLSKSAQSSGEHSSILPVSQTCQTSDFNGMSPATFGLPLSSTDENVQTRLLHSYGIGLLVGVLRTRMRSSNGVGEWSLRWGWKRWESHTRLQRAANDVSRKTLRNSSENTGTQQRRRVDLLNSIFRRSRLHLLFRAWFRWRLSISLQVCLRTKSDEASVLHSRLVQATQSTQDMKNQLKESRAVERRLSDTLTSALTEQLRIIEASSAREQTLKETVAFAEEKSQTAMVEVERVRAELNVMARTLKRRSRLVKRLLRSAAVSQLVQNNDRRERAWKR